jgi:hypothetical protein
MGYGVMGYGGPTLRLRLVWGYLHFVRFVPSGLLKEFHFINLKVAVW